MDKPESCADELPKKEGEQADSPKRCWTYGPVTHRLREESRQATSSGKLLAVPATAGELLAEPALSLSQQRCIAVSHHKDLSVNLTPTR